jgi:hypothetical protein
MRELAIHDLGSVGGGRDDALAVQVLAAAAATAVWSSLTNRTDTSALFTAIKRSWIPTAMTDVACATAFPNSAVSSPLNPVGPNYQRWACACVSGAVQGYFQLSTNPLGGLLSSI